MTKILVTGGKGMIGLAIRKNLDSESWDLKDGQDVKEIEKCDGKYDGIIHLAAQSRVLSGFENPVETWNDNTVGTIKVLEKARRDESWVINGSSLTAGHSHNIYSFSKLATEELCKIYSGNYGVRTISVQFSTVYGSIHDLPGRFIPYVTNMLKEFPKRLMLEDRTAMLSPTYIEDVSKIILTLSKSKKNEWHGQVNPIISEEGFLTTEELVTKMCQAIGSFPELIWGKKRKWDSRLKRDYKNALLTPKSFEEGYSSYLRKLSIGQDKLSST